MPAAPPGTVSLSCTTADGVLTATIGFDPDTGDFRADAITVVGEGAGRLEIVLDDGSIHSIPISAGNTIHAETLADDGIPDWARIHSIVLTAGASP